MQPGFDGGDNLDLEFVLERAFGVKLGGLLDIEQNSVDGVYEFIGHRIELKDPKNLDFMSCPTSRAYLYFKEILLQCNPSFDSQLAPSTDLEKLIPEDVRPVVWRELSNKGLRLPDLGIPAWCSSLAFLIALMTAGAFVAYVVTTALYLACVMFIGVPMAITTGLTFAPRIFWKWGRKIPRPLNTARGMATFLAYRNCEPEWIPRMTRRQVKDVIRLVAALEYDVPLEDIDDFRLPFPRSEKYIPEPRKC